MSLDSSDEEDQKLMEAVDSTLINDSMFQPKEDKSSKVEPETPLPSLRRSKNDEDEQFNQFRVTPEFRNYVAKHLALNLDKHLETLLRDPKKSEVARYKHCNRVKLFRNSAGFIRLKDAIPVQQKSAKKSPDNSDEEWEKCKSVAVNSADVLAQKDTQFWSQRTKAPVFKYVQTEQGLQSAD